MSYAFGGGRASTIAFDARSKNNKYKQKLKVVPWAGNHVPDIS